MKINDDFWKGYFISMVVCCFLILLFSMLFGGCATAAGLQGKDAELIAANSRDLGRIESAVDAIGDTITDSNERLEIVARAGSRIRDAGERLNYLFDEYEREVSRILDELYSLRARLQEGEKDKMDRMDSRGD